MNNPELLWVIAGISFINLWISWKKRNEDFFKLGIDLYTRLVELLISEKIPNEDGMSIQKRYHQKIARNEQREKLYLEAKFLFGLDTYKYLKSKYSLAEFRLVEKTLKENAEMEKNKYFSENPHLITMDQRREFTAATNLKVTKALRRTPPHIMEGLNRHFEEFLFIGHRWTFELIRIQIYNSYFGNLYLRLYREKVKIETRENLAKKMYKFKMFFNRILDGN